LVSWLGVTMYLSTDAIAGTLASLGGFARGSELIVDYMLTPDLRDEAGQVYVDLVAPAAAQYGEPWLTFLSPSSMKERLEKHGFTLVEDVGQRDAIDASLWERTDALRPAELSHLARALLSCPP
jgi:O-methyltransferase involved in polyketide biosynthesis